MIDDPHSAAASEALEAIGYKVEPIPVGPDESADLWAYVDADRLTVEVKSRVDDLDIAAELEIEPSKVVTKDTLLVRTDPLGRIIRKARSQLLASQSRFPGLSVLWFRPDPALGLSNNVEQMRANLLGARWVSYRVDGQFGFAPAFLVVRTDFHRFPELDAAVLDSTNGAQLLVNPYSPRKDRIRTSLMHQFFDAGGAVVDLDVLPSDRNHFILRSEVDRADEQAVLGELARQHPGYAFLFSDMHAFTGFTRFSRDDLQE